MQTRLNLLRRASSRRKVDIEGDNSDASEAAAVMRRPKKGPAYQYSAHEDTAILRAFARSASCAGSIPVFLPCLLHVLNSLLCLPCVTDPCPLAAPSSVRIPPQPLPALTQSPCCLFCVPPHPPSLLSPPSPPPFIDQAPEHVSNPSCWCLCSAQHCIMLFLAVPVGFSKTPQRG